VLVKGPNPLELALSRRYGAVLYASDKEYLKVAVADDADWKCAKIQEDALVSINTNTLKIANVVPVRWEGYSPKRERHTGWRDALGGTNTYRV
jgi:hypothetical protein